MQILTTIMMIAIFIFIPKNTKAYNENNEINTDMILEEQQSSFGIRDFLKEAENYSPDFVKDLDISDIFNSALTGKIDNTIILKKILNLLGVQVTDTLKILINILLIVLIHMHIKINYRWSRKWRSIENCLLCSICFNCNNNNG